MPRDRDKARQRALKRTLSRIASRRGVEVGDLNVQTRQRAMRRATERTANRFPQAAPTPRPNLVPDRPSLVPEPTTTPTARSALTGGAAVGTASSQEPSRPVQTAGAPAGETVWDPQLTAKYKSVDLAQNPDAANFLIQKFRQLNPNQTKNGRPLSDVEVLNRVRAILGPGSDRSIAGGTDSFPIYDAQGNLIGYSRPGAGGQDPQDLGTGPGAGSPPGTAPPAGTGAGAAPGGGGAGGAPAPQQPGFNFQFQPFFDPNAVQLQDVNPVPTDGPIQLQRLDRSAEDSLRDLGPVDVSPIAGRGEDELFDFEPTQLQRLDPEAEATLQEMRPETRQRVSEILETFDDPSGNSPLAQEVRKQVSNLLRLGPQADIESAAERMANVRERMIPMREAASRRAISELQSRGLVNSPGIVAKVIGEIDSEVQNTLIQEFREVVAEEAERAQERFFRGLDAGLQLGREDREFSLQRRDRALAQAGLEADESLDIERLRETARQRRTQENVSAAELEAQQRLENQRLQEAARSRRTDENLAIGSLNANQNIEIERLREAARQRRTQENLQLGAMELEARRVANEGRAIDGNLILQNNSQKLAYQEFLFNAGMSQAQFELMVEQARLGDVRRLEGFLLQFLSALQQGFI